MRVSTLVLRLVLLAFAAMLSTPPLPGAPALDGKDVTDRTLDNGLHVIVKSEPATDLVAIGLYVRAGSITEQEWPDGISRFVNELVFDGPKESKAAKIRQQLASLGGRLTSGVTRDFTHAHMAVASPYLQRALEMLAELVGARTFAPTVVSDVRQALVRQLRDVENSATAIELRMMNLLWGLAFERHPYGKVLGGTAESIGRITPANASQYYARFYVPNNMSLIVVGDATPGEVAAAAAGTLGRLPRKDIRWRQPAPEPPQTSLRTATIPIPAQRHAFMMAFHGPGIGTHDKRDVCAMDVIYTILGQGERGRLIRALREEKQLAVAADVEFVTRRDPGLFVVTCVAAEDQELAARRAVLEALRRITEEPLKPDELAAAKKLLRDAYAFSNETLMDQTGSMGFYDCIDTYKFAIEYIAEVNKVTAKDVQRTARRYLRLDAYTLVTAQPTTTTDVKKASL